MIYKSQMNTPLVSVIVPMYKVASLLPAFLERVQEQTYKHLQLIFVDDASPDNSSEIIKESLNDLTSQGFEVVLLVHETNKGVACARNTALDVASGEFVYSWDADDLLESNGIELMVSEAMRTNADIVGCECYLSYQSNQRHLSQPQVHSVADAFEKMCKGVMKWNLWLFLLRRSVIENGESLRFLPGQNMGEDMMFMGKLMLRADKISIVHRALYHYVKTNTEAQTNHYTAKQWEQVMTNFVALESSVSETQNAKKKELLNYLKLNLKLPLLFTKELEDLKRWNRLYPEANAYIWSNELLPYRTKFVQALAANKLWWFVRLYRYLVMEILYKILYK